MNLFQCNTQSVLNYMMEHSCGQTQYSLFHSCYAQLDRYLNEHCLNYSLDNANQWLEGQSKSNVAMQAYEKAILRLDDIYKAGHIRFANRFRKSLSGTFDDIISSYLSDVLNLYSEKHLPNIRNRCRYFFSFLQQEQVLSSPYDISYNDILAFYKGPLHDLSAVGSCMYKGTVMKFLSWMALHQMCPIGFSMILHMNHAEKIIMLEDLAGEAAEVVRSLKKDSYIDFPPDEFYSASHEFCNDLKELGYAATMMASAQTTLDLLYLFLDMNHLGYHPVIIREWFKTAYVFFGSNSHMSRRVLALFEMYAQEGAVYPERTFVYKCLMYDSLPTWCKEPLRPFLEQKNRENKAASTISMYRSAAVRFCQFLVSEGLTAFDQLSAGLLKKFNVSDKHETIEGKNAYNVRIRKFLFYLAEHNYVGNYFLREALPCASAPKTRIVQVLSEEESLVLEQYDEFGSPSLGLRNHAIVLIGLKMGLRASDITSLELNQIDWGKGSIRFLQDKTDVEKTFPMPVEVGNALYRYLLDGRPPSRSSYIFITHKAPYKKIERSVCNRIMKKVFPKRPKKLMGFHATRRTYATQLFRNQCGCSMVADLLGHTTTGTVHKYISLDGERMRLCPASLESAGISFIGGFRNE